MNKQVFDASDIVAPDPEQVKWHFEQGKHVFQQVKVFWTNKLFDVNDIVVPGPKQVKWHFEQRKPMFQQLKVCFEQASI